jgi:hypothetical protein
VKLNVEIKSITDLEVFERKFFKVDGGYRFRRAFKRRSMIVAVNDKFEIHIRFMDARSQLLNDLKVGQRIKLLMYEPDEPIDYNKLACPFNLLGWDVEVLK